MTTLCSNCLNKYIPVYLYVYMPDNTPYNKLHIFAECTEGHGMVTPPIPHGELGL